MTKPHEVHDAAFQNTGDLGASFDELDGDFVAGNNIFVQFDVHSIGTCMKQTNLKFKTTLNRRGGHKSMVSPSTLSKTVGTRQSIRGEFAKYLLIALGALQDRVRSLGVFHHPLC